MNISRNQVRAADPCGDTDILVRDHLGRWPEDNEPLPLSLYAQTVNMEDFFLILKILPKSMHPQIRLLACDLAEQIVSHSTREDPRPLKCLAAARRFARGEINKNEMDAARDEAWAAVPEWEGGNLSAFEKDDKSGWRRSAANYGAARSAYWAAADHFHIAECANAAGWELCWFFPRRPVCVAWARRLESLGHS